MPVDICLRGSCMYFASGSRATGITKLSPVCGYLRAKRAHLALQLLLLVLEQGHLFARLLQVYCI